MKINKSYLKKYNKQGPRYTSYPPANLFSNEYNEADFISAIKKSNTELPEDISVYIHIPFCPQICHFCGCTTETGFSYNFIETYVQSLLKEIDMQKQYIDTKNRKLIQVHWGGGTPNAIPYKFIKMITEKIRNTFTFSDNYEMAIECSPAYFKLKHVEILKQLGFNRISLGIQDFDQKVLDAINRKTSRIPVRDIISKIKSEGFTGTNIDLVYGLPLQTVKGFNKTLKKAIALDVDRIVTFSYAHVPSIIERQKVLEEIGLPSSSEKAKMYQNAYEMITQSGYNSIGMDHFSKPSDQFSVAQLQRKLHRNFQGYCTTETTGQVYGFGASSISQLYSSYSQNEKNAAKYIKNIRNKKIPVIRGYSLNDNEKIIRDIINQVMCNFYVDLNEVAVKHKKTTDDVIKIISFSKEKFIDFINDDIMEINDFKIKVFDMGRIVIRNIAMRFDPLMQKTTNSYSKTI